MEQVSVEKDKEQTKIVLQKVKVIKVSKTKTHKFTRNIP